MDILAEELDSLVRRHAGARIMHLDTDAIARDPRAQYDGALGWGELECVARKVRERLVGQRRIAACGRKSVSQFGGDGDLLSFGGMRVLADHSGGEQVE